jgi:hypothetical protein
MSILFYKFDMCVRIQRMISLTKSGYNRFNDPEAIVFRPKKDAPPEKDKATPKK